MDTGLAAWEAAIAQLNPARKQRQISPEDQAALATPATLAAHLWPAYQRRSHTDLIAQAIADAEAEVSPKHRGPRVMVDQPPQSGKTETAVIWAAFWWLCKHPTKKLMIISYGIELAVERGDRIRKLVQEHGHRYGLQLDPSTAAKHNWKLLSGGALRCFGIRTGITGHPADCLTGETCIVTPSGRKTLKQFTDELCVEPVLSYNHDTEEQEWANVEAWRKIPGRGIITVHTESGAAIRCTPDHRIYVKEKGYIQAALLQPGDTLIQAEWPLPELRETDRPRVAPVLGVLHGAESSKGLPGHQLLILRNHVQADEGRDGQEGAARAKELLLLEPMPGGSYADCESPQMPDVRDPDGRGAHEKILLRAMPGDGKAQEGPLGGARIGPLPALFNAVQTAYIEADLLFENVCERSALEEDDRSRELALQRWQELCPLVPADAPAHIRTRHGLCGMRENECHHPFCAQRETGDPDSNVGPSHRRGPVKQPLSEPSRPVPAMPHVAPQGQTDTVRDVVRLRGEGVDVYDLQVARNRNFFADEILVHNCIWIDDPTKSRAEADSPVFRAAVHNAYSGDINSRLAPGAPLFIVATRWDEDDLPGRRLREEGLKASGGRWRQIHLPALCTDPENDPLGRKLGEPLPHPHIDEGDTVSLLRHWEEKRSGSTVRDWAALYQGDPKPLEGALLTWDLLRERRCYEQGSCGEPKRIAVAIDPSGGGEDVAGIIGGYLSTDDKLYLTHDRSGQMSSALWARKACELAAEIDADCFIVERDYGGDMAALNLRTTWAELRRENPDRYSVFHPKVIECKSGKRGKIVRAEPIAQQWIEGRVWTAQYLPDVEAEWATYQAGSPNSPGRLDASVWMAIELLPLPPSGQAQVMNTLAMGNIDLTSRLSPGTHS